MSDFVDFSWKALFILRTGWEGLGRRKGGNGNWVSYVKSEKFVLKKILIKLFDIINYWGSKLNNFESILCLFMISKNYKIFLMIIALLL